MSDTEKLQAHFHDVGRLRGFEIAGLSALFSQHPALIPEANDGTLEVRWSRRLFATLKQSLIVEKNNNVLVLERLFANKRAELIIVPITPASGSRVER